MAKHFTSTPGAPPAVAGLQTCRRDILSAISLAAAAVVGFARPDNAASAVPSFSPDVALLAACTAFQAAHHAEALASDDDELVAEAVAEWYHAADSIIAAPAPRTEAGRIALARAAHLALVDQITDGGDLLAQPATREEALALAALDAMRRAVA